MEFTTTAQADTYNKVALWLRELFGQFPCARPDLPALGLFMNSALVEVFVYPWKGDDAVIHTRSYVVTGIELTQDLLDFLLRENAQMLFGAFGIDPNGDILFEHTIVGSTCDKLELEASVKAVLDVADSYDDHIVEKWGGATALSRLQQ